MTELKAAGEEGKVRTVKRFGPKTEQKLLEAVSLAKKPRNEINIHKALRLAEEVLSYLQFADGVKQIEIAGPLRRWRGDDGGYHHRRQCQARRLSRSPS